MSMQRLFPFTGWLGKYRSSWLVPDAVAGLVVWALIVPESMAYAAIAGVPVQFGLYSVPIAVLGYAMFGTSKRLFVGPSSTVASLSAATVAPLAATGTTDYIALTAALAILVGVLYIVLGLLRMGFIARFFAKPVLDGFIVGLGLYIAVGQLYKVVGVPKPSGNTVEKFWDVLTSVDDWNGATVIVGFASLAILFGLAKFAPKVPGALVVVVLGIAATSAFDLTAHGVAIVGTVPTGFHFVSWSGVSLDDLWEMIPGALGIIVVGFAQSVAIAKAYSAEDNEPIDPSGEMIGYGAASIGAGVLQGYTPTGSLSKSAAAGEAGSEDARGVPGDGDLRRAHDPLPRQRLRRPPRSRARRDRDPRRLGDDRLPEAHAALASPRGGLLARPRRLARGDPDRDPRRDRHRRGAQPRAPHPPAGSPTRRDPRHEP